jgi:trimethylamine:corrinoid methyltransferase-like protein
VTHTPDIISFTPLLQSTVDDAAAVARLQAGTLEILERIGVCIPCEAALRVFRRHGADVDGDGIVRIPPTLVESALATAPRSFVLGGRESRFDLVLDGARTYLSTEGVGTLVRARRPARRAPRARPTSSSWPVSSTACQRSRSSGRLSVPKTTLAPPPCTSATPD